MENKHKNQWSQDHGKPSRAVRQILASGFTQNIGILYIMDYLVCLRQIHINQVDLLFTL